MEPERTEKLNKIEHLKKVDFLVAYAACGTITGAAKKAKVGRTTHYFWMESDPDYVAAFEEAHKMATDLLEEEARRRAYSGVLEPVYQGGVQVGSKRVYSDTLLIFLLKGNNQEKFRERSQVNLGGTVKTTDLDLSRLPSDKLRQLESILSEAAVDDQITET